MDAQERISALFAEHGKWRVVRSYCYELTSTCGLRFPIEMLLEGASEELVASHAEHVKTFHGSVQAEIAFLSDLGCEIPAETWINVWMAALVSPNHALALSFLEKTEGLLATRKVSEERERLNACILLLFSKFEKRAFVQLVANQLETRLCHYMSDLLDYEKWDSAPGFEDPTNEYYCVSKRLRSTYNTMLGAAKRDFDWDDVYEKFVREFGHEIPLLVWAEVFAQDLLNETEEDPASQTNDLLTFLGEAAKIRERTEKRAAVEEALEDRIEEDGYESFIASFCDALEAQEDPIVRNFEELLSPQDWDNLGGEASLDEMYATGEELGKLYKRELAQLQVAFLRKHGTRIPRHVLPRTLAYEAMKEDTYCGGETTAVLESMGVHY